MEVAVADPLVQSVAAEPVLDGSLQLREGDGDLRLVQFVEETGEDLCTGGVDVDDGFGRDDDPTDGFGGSSNGGSEAASEVVDVGEEERSVEPEQQQPGDGGLRDGV